MPRIRLGEVATTFDPARSWAEVNPGAPAVMIASRQTAGRGRLGRSWESPEGGCWLTLVWPMESAAPAGLAGLLAAGAAAGVIEAEIRTVISAAEPPKPVCIRWPNDLLIGGAKAGGLLGETVTLGGRTALLLGIGINVNNPIGSSGAPLRTPAVSLAEVLGRGVDLDRFTDDLIDGVAGAMAGAVAGLVAGLEGPSLTAEQVDGLNRRLAYRGEAVRLEGAGPAVDGRLAGIDSSGRLLIDTGHAGGLRAVASGEVSCRPADAGS